MAVSRGRTCGQSPFRVTTARGVSRSLGPWCCGIRTGGPTTQDRRCAWFGDRDEWHTEVIDGSPDQQPTFAAAVGKAGQECVLPVLRPRAHAGRGEGQGFAGQYETRCSRWLTVATAPARSGGAPRADEITAAASADDTKFAPFGVLSAVPDEPIPPGNNHTIRASAYGYRTYGDLMNKRQTAAVRRDGPRHPRRPSSNCSALGSARITRPRYPDTRQLTCSEGCGTRPGVPSCGSHGNADGTEQNRVTGRSTSSRTRARCRFQFDYLETGPGEGPGHVGERR